MRAAIAALLLVFALATPARAETAANLYAAGSYRAAAESGEREGGAAGNLIAARALLALAVGEFRGPETAAWLDRAQRDAEVALGAAPASVSARLQLAMALGMKGRRASIKEALKADYAKRGRRLIDEAVKLEPENAWAQALLGGWHLEVVRRGGGIGATFLGASTRAGVRAFDRARAIAPRDPVIAFQYALAILSVDPERHGEKAGALLAQAASAAPKDAFEAGIRDEARQLAAVLASKGPMAAAQSAAAAYL